MIFFFNTFLALRCHSPSQDPIYISDTEKWLAGERTVWSAFVHYKEDTYRLHLLEDGDTQAVRIAAMVDAPGPRSNMTIWTTFCRHLSPSESHVAYYFQCMNKLRDIKTGISRNLQLWSYFISLFSTSRQYFSHEITKNFRFNFLIPEVRNDPQSLIFLHSNSGF